MFFICLLLSFWVSFYAYRKYPHLCPLKIATYFWTFQIAFLVVFGYDFLIFRYTGVLYIIACLILLNIGAGLIRVDYAKIDRIHKKYHICYNTRRMVRILVLLIVLGFVLPIQAIVSHGFNLSDLMDLSMLLEVNNSLSVSRYTDDQEVNRGLFIQFFGVFSYCSPLLGGFILPVCAVRKDRLICIISLLPLLFGGLTQGVKMGIIVSVFIFLAGYITSSFLLNKRLVIRVKTLIYGGCGALALLSILLLSMMFRIGRVDMDTLAIVVGKLVSYAFGHLPAFDLWFDRQPLFSDSLTFGGKLFLGITNFLGFMKREQGLYHDMETIALDGSVTNVYTIFRVLIDDFGILFCPLFCLLLGIYMQYIYRNISMLINYKFLSMICCMVIFVIFWSFVTSALVYTTYIVVFVLFYIIIYFNLKKIPNA